MELGWSVVIKVVAVIASLAAISFVVKAILNTLAIYSRLRNVPAERESQHWLLGHGPKLLRMFLSGEALDWLASLTPHYGKVILFNIGPFFPFVMVTHPDIAKVTLGKDPKADIVYSGMKPWLGESLLTGNGKKWGRTRRLLTPAFHFDILKPYIKVYEDCAKEFVAKWKQQSDGTAHDVYPSISLLTLDVMLRCTCSYTSNCQTARTHSPYVSAVYQLSDLIIERALFFPAYYDWVYALMPASRRFRKACNLVHEFSMDVITTRRAALEERKAKGEDVSSGKTRKYLDFIDLLLEARDEEGKGLSNEEIRAEVDTFMFEGHDTTASGLAWTLYNLARFPEHQDLCREEIDDLFDKKDEIEWDDLKTLSHIKYCLKESLRLFPPVPVVIRQLSKDTVLGRHVIPKDVWTSTNIYSIHHNAEVWDDPEEFIPSRFAPENSTDRHSHAFLAFSAGQRNCIGREFALNEEIVLLAHILRNFTVSIDDEHRDVAKHFMIILRPKNGLFLKFTPRVLN